MEILHPLRRRDDEPLRAKRMRRGMYLLPGLFTTANLGAGYYAISQAVQGTLAEPWHFDFAAIAIGFAVLFDGLDGRIARLTGTTSDFGRELDSLADVVTFGVAPAVLAWIWGFRMLPASSLPFDDADWRVKLLHMGAIASFLFLIAGASRLARFNIQKNPQPSNPGRPGKKYFVGMPIPAGAGVIAAVVHFSSGQPLQIWWWSAIWLALVLALAFLMVSTWRFYSFKDLDLRHRHTFRNMVLIAALAAAIWYFSRFVLFFIALTYMLSGVIARLFFVFRRGTPRTSDPGYKEAPQLR